MVNMKLEYIKAVLALSKSKSFGEAAENVFSTQSSLSKQILSVEKELGIIRFPSSRRFPLINLKMKPSL